MIEVIFLAVLAAIWILFAVFSDVRTTEIFNWLNFSLIVFALGFRFFYSLFSNQGFEFFYQGLIGFGIFFVFGNFLYYSRVFAGGDAKLMYSLGAVLPFSVDFSTNLRIFATFVFLFLFSGAIYGLFSSVYLAVKNYGEFKKEIKKMHKQLLKFSIPIEIFGLAIMILGILLNGLLVYLGIIIFIMPLLYVFTKSVDESCMVKEVSSKDLMEGDWLYKDVKVGRKLIKANWDGLTKKEISLLKKNSRKVIVRRGISFAPVFLISFLVLVYFYIINSSLFSSLWNSLW